MKSFRSFGLFALAALGWGVFASRLEAQEFYGYTVAMNQASGQASGQAPPANVYPPGCAPTTTPPGCVTLPPIGCNTTPCAPPTINCPPSTPGMTHTVCVVYCDQPPTYKPITITITRNYYVPINIQNNAPPNIQPVNLAYQWQPICYLAGPNGEPINQAGQPLSNPPGLIPPPTSGTAAPAMPSSQQGSILAPPPGNLVEMRGNTGPLAAPVAVAAPTPASAPASAPQKSWVWLAKQAVFGYGYMRPDGRWVIDEGSKRATLPTTPTLPPPPSMSTATTTASVN